MVSLCTERKRMRPERIIREYAQDHDYKKHEWDYHVGKNNFILIFTVHEHSDYKGRFDGRNDNGSDDIPLTKVDLSSKNCNDRKDK